MKKTHLLFLLLLAACTSPAKKQEDLKEKVTAVLMQYGKNNIDSTDTLDSLQIVKIDTLTSKKLEYVISDAYWGKLTEINNNINKLADVIKQEDALNDYVGMPHKKIDAGTAEDIKLIIAKQKTLDSLWRIHVARAKTADNANFLNYLVTYHIVYSNKAGVQKGGNLEDIVTKDFKIKEREDYLENF